MKRVTVKWRCGGPAAAAAALEDIKQCALNDHGPTAVKKKKKKKNHGVGPGSGRTYIIRGARAEDEGGDHSDHDTTPHHTTLGKSFAVSAWQRSRSAVSTPLLLMHFPILTSSSSSSDRSFEGCRWWWWYSSVDRAEKLSCALEDDDACDDCGSGQAGPHLMHGFRHYSRPAFWRRLSQSAHLMLPPSLLQDLGVLPRYCHIIQPIFQPQFCFDSTCKQSK